MVLGHYPPQTNTSVPPPPHPSAFVPLFQTNTSVVSGKPNAYSTMAGTPSSQLAWLSGLSTNFNEMSADQKFLRKVCIVFSFHIHFRTSCRSVR